jgi:hypothetical protein
MSTRAPSRLPVFRAVLVAGVLALLGAGAGVGTASAASSWWVLDSNSAPTNLAPGSEALVIASALNEGYAEVDGTSKPIVMSDTLPAGLEVKSVLAEAGPDLTSEKRQRVVLSCTTEESTVSCPFTGKIVESESIRLKISVVVSKEAPEGTLSNQIHIEGASTTAATLTRPLAISNEATKFGVEHYELKPENDDGSIDAQAGSHPFQLTTVFDLNQTYEEHLLFGKKLIKSPFAPALAKNLHFVLPPGMIGKAAKFPQCSGADFATLTPGGADLCAADTAIGYAIVTVNEPILLGYFEAAVPVFNITPSPGEPARFGFEVHDVPVVLTTAVRSGSDYAVEVTVNEATQVADVLNSQVTFWGVPGDPRHDAERGWECLEGGWWVEGVEPEKPCKPSEDAKQEAFLTLPTSCGAEPVSTVSGESWNGLELTGEQRKFTFAPFQGCAALPFTPTISVEPDSHAAATPSGLTVKVHVPQETTISGTGLAESDIKKTTLALPVGIQASGGAADGLLTCTGQQFGFNGSLESIEALSENDHFDTAAVKCPDAAKIGTVKIGTPLLENELTGDVYLASADTNPFGSPLVLYIFAEDEESGVQVKLAGEVHLDPNTGQLVSVFNNTPPVPFEDLTLHLLDGARASQTTPEVCGSYSASASFEGWSGASAAPSSAPFAITSGAGGTPCAPAGTEPFAPSFQAGSASAQAGAFSPFTVTIGRPDGDQALKTITVHEPLGAAAMLASVAPCPIAQATAAIPSCPASSLIGKSIAIAGLGRNPVEIPGEVFLTGPYKGAPFGLLALTNAEKVGPFNLGKIPVMSRITVDETTAQASIASDPLPLFVKGVPSQIKALNVTVDRAGFTFNPTNCGSLEASGTLTGYGPGGSEATENVSTPYHPANCASLPFKPTVTVSTEANYSRVDGLGMKILVTSGQGQANIKKTKLVFPSSLPSRLTTIQKACPAAVFEANPASCPEGSVIGTGIAHTPVLKTPLTGPAYLVSHGGAAFPDAEFVLQSEGIKLVLDGKTNISKGITSSTFATVPDAPVETFEVTLPRGPHSAFSGYGNLCSKALKMPTEFGGQNGALIEETTKISVKNCSGVLPSKVESKLAKALKACKKVNGKKKRASCEAKARKKYGAKKKSKKAAKKTARRH